MTRTELTADVAAWLACDELGSQAAKLRNAAYCALEDSVSVSDFVAACKANGVNAGTARNRWHEVWRTL